jgi:hypothetical protein
MSSILTVSPFKLCLLRKFGLLYGTFILITIIRSAIMSPKDKSIIVHDGKIQLEGWAYSGNGCWVERVEVSSDG